MHLHHTFVHVHVTSLNIYDFSYMYIICRGNGAHFNFIFYSQIAPSPVCTTADVWGAKKAKDHITVALAVDVTASERLKPVVIHKYKKPRCFGGTFNPNSLVMYYSNTNAWMHTDVRKN